MATPFIGEIRLVGFNFAPLGWAECDGSLLLISQNDALFTLIGTTYGGDGQSTFALPDLRGRVALGRGNAHIIGEVAGTESETLTINQLPAHTHPQSATPQGGNSAQPQGKVYAQLSNATKSDKIYGTPADANAASSMVNLTGGSQPHENRQPFLTMRYVIALEGIFPTQN